MKKISYKGYRFPAEIIQQAIWLYLRFTMSFRDVEDLLAERGIAVTYETCGPIGPQPKIWEFRIAMSAVDGTITEPRTPINPPDDENARCRDSRAQVQPRDFFQLTPPLTILQRPTPFDFSKD